MSVSSVDQIQVMIDVFTRYKGAVTGGVDQIIERLGFQYIPSPALANGTLVNQFDRVLYKPATAITSGNSTDLNMQDGTNWEYGLSSGPTDVLGNAVALAEIMLLFIISTANSVGILQVGAAAATQWTAPFAASGAPTTAKIPIHKNGFMLLVSQADPAYAVAAGDKLLRLTASGGNVEWKGIAFGRSA